MKDDKKANWVNRITFLAEEYAGTQQLRTHIEGEVLACMKDAVESCAQLLDREADIQEKIWEDFLKSDKKGPATDFHTIPKHYASMLRKENK